eukprot:gene7124-12778_t
MAYQNLADLKKPEDDKCCEWNVVRSNKKANLFDKIRITTSRKKLCVKSLEMAALKLFAVLLVLISVFLTKANGSVRNKRAFGSSICGHRTYDPTFQLCCWGVVNSKTGISPACCGTKAYDAKFNLCCSWTIQSRSGIEPRCCGTRNYDAKFSICCQGVVHSRSGIRPACCGRQLYDAAFRQCCNGQIC